MLASSSHVKNGYISFTLSQYRSILRRKKTHAEVVDPYIAVVCYYLFNGIYVVSFLSILDIKKIKLKCCLFDVGIDDIGALLFNARFLDDHK